MINRQSQRFGTKCVTTADISSTDNHAAAAQPTCTARPPRRRLLMGLGLRLTAVILFSVRAVHRTASLFAANATVGITPPRNPVKIPGQSYKGHEAAARQPFTFSACLLIKDANIILPEWLAYHWTVLPMRRLIVALDPLSLTNPEPILDRYRDLGLDITVWTNDSFVFVDREKYKHPHPDFLTPSSTDKERLEFYKWRQRCFYTACLRRLKTENRTWTALVDADEYIAFNYYDGLEVPPKRCTHKQTWNPHKFVRHPSEMHIRQCHLDYVFKIRKGLHSRSKLPPPGGGVTAAEHIASGVNSMFRRSKLPCIVFSRVMIGAKESDAEQIRRGVPDGFDPALFHTLRYRKRGEMQNFIPGKSFVDASRYNDRQVVDNPHRPLLERCRSWDNAYVDNAEMPFRVYHHTGSLDTFLRPGYDSRGEATFKKRQRYKVEAEDDTLRPWLAEFVRLVGKERALELTQGLRLNATREIKRLALGMTN